MTSQIRPLLTYYLLLMIQQFISQIMYQSDYDINNLTTTVNQE